MTSQEVLRCTQKNPRTWYVKAPTSTTLLKPAAYYCEKWHAYNLIRPSDLLTASAIRRVTTELSSTGSTSSQRVHTNLTIRVKSLDFDPQAGQLHVSGQIARENRYTKIGQFHTLDLELQRNFTLEKEVEGAHGGEGWDSIGHFRRLRAAQEK